MNNKNDNIEKIFQETFERFEANVDPTVWNNIKQAISNSSATIKPDGSSSVSGSIGVKTLVPKLIGGLLILGAAALGAYFMITSNSQETKQPVKQEVARSFNDELSGDPVSQQSEVEIKTSPKEVDSEIKQNELTTDKESGVVDQSMIVDEQEVEKGDASVNVRQVNPPETVVQETNYSSGDIVTPQEEDVAQKQENNWVENDEPSITKTEAVETPQNVDPDSEESMNVSVSINDIPNVITPNNDGKNDVIRISGEGIERVEVLIMDKTGKPIFTIRSTEDEWKGKDQGGYDLLPGVYFMAGSILDSNGNTHSIKQTINLFK